MMRKRSLSQTPDPKGRELVAKFFGLSVSDVQVEPQEETYSIYISGNLEAQAKYKECNPWGNTSTPKRFDFRDRLLVIWNGKKVQPA